MNCGIMKLTKIEIRLFGLSIYIYFIDMIDQRKQDMNFDVISINKI